MKRHTEIHTIVLCALYASVLFIQEQALSWLPNIQLTVLIIMVLGATLDLKWGFLVVLVHTIADNLLWASFTPYTFIPMLIGWEFTLLLGYLSKNKALGIVVLNGIIASFIYCWLFIPFNVLILKVDFLVYLVADIPFEILFIMSTIVTLIWLYKPLKTLINKQWNSLESKH